MRALFIALLLASQALAQVVEVPPLEFKPLTELPWKERPDGALSEHLHRIFLEPDPAIRYPVLAAYLRQIAVNDLETAFDLCLKLEGTQCPKELIAFFLPLWAQRDPQSAWKRTASLFELQDTDWLGHDSWSKEKIVFRNLEAMRKSSFWLDPRWLENFLTGLKLSTLDEAAKNALRAAFMAKWDPIYGSPPSDHPTGGYAHEAEGLLAAFEVPLSELREELVLSANKKQAAAMQILLRRWLVAQPEKAHLIVSLAEKLKSDPPEFFLLWLHRDPESLIEWVEAHMALSEPPYRIIGMVLSRFESVKREKWLQNVQSRDPEGEELADVLYEWAGWEAEDAMSKAIASQNAYAIARTVEGIVYGGFSRGTANTTRHGLSYIRDFDLSRLPKADPVQLFDDWYILMEQWGDIDIGEAARYGLDFILKTDYTPRENLLKLFAGDDTYGSDSDMIDRTFCALRMWAALRPGEMKGWIATLRDAEMRVSLTWLLENPWGHDPSRK